MDLRPGASVVSIASLLEAPPTIRRVQGQWPHPIPERGTRRARRSRPTWAASDRRASVRAIRTAFLDGWIPSPSEIALMSSPCHPTQADDGTRWHCWNLMNAETTAYQWLSYTGMPLNVFDSRRRHKSCLGGSDSVWCRIPGVRGPIAKLREWTLNQV